MWIGLLALATQSQSIAEVAELSLLERISFAGYGFVMYWVKLVVPTGLVAFYPYPVFEAGGSVDAWYMVMPVVAMLIIGIPFLLVRGNLFARKVFVVGMGFFVLFVALVLQLLQVGSAVMADRYTYVPYIGSFLMLAILADHLIVRYGRIAIVVIVALSMVLVPLTYTQVQVWTTSGTLWGNVISQYVDESSGTTEERERLRVRIAKAYIGRGIYNFDRGQFDKAFEDLRFLEASNDLGAGNLQRLATLYRMRGDAVGAVRVLTLALDNDADQGLSRYYRGLAYGALRQWDSAMADLRAALDSPSTLVNREATLVALANAALEAGQVDDALRWSAMLTNESPSNSRAWFIRGIVLGIRGDDRGAASALDSAVRRDRTNGDAWLNLTVARLKLGDKGGARQAADEARSRGKVIDPSLQARMR